MIKALPISTRIRLLFILVMACVLFLPSLNYEFTNWDDDIHVTNNPAIQQFSLESLTQLFHPGIKYMYHPLTLVTYALEWNVGGNSAWIFHASNVLLHLLNIVLVFLLLRKILSSDIAAVFGVAIFAIHPLQVESVAWISARKELLYAFFYLASLLIYFQWDEKKKVRLYVLSLFFFLCSLLSKPTAVTLPFVILLAEYYRSKRLEAKAVYKVIPFLIGTVVFTLLIITNQHEHAIPSLRYYSFPQQILLIVYQVAFYFWKFALPVQLSACYAYPRLENGILPMQYYLTPLFVAGFIIILWLFKKKSKNLFPGLLLYLIALSPVLQIIPFNNASLVADRYMYLPIIGLIFFVYQIAELIKSQLSHQGAGVNAVRKVCYGLILLSIFIFALGRIDVWQNSITLFDDVIDKNHNISIAYGNRANVKVQKGDFGGAVEDCDRFIEINPDNGKVFYNRGNANSGLESYSKAVYDFTRSINLGYTTASVYYNRGNANYKSGMIDSALADYRNAKIQDPTFADANYSIGYVMLYSMKDPKTAVKYFDTALSFNPNYVEAFYQRALGKYQLRLYGSALNDLAAAISYQPTLQNDSLVPRINRSIDSVNATISTVGKQIAANPKTKSYYVQRSKLYLMLGDSVRADIDLKMIGR